MRMQRCDPSKRKSRRRKSRRIVFPFNFVFTYETHYRSVHAGSDGNAEEHDPSRNWAKGGMCVIFRRSPPIVWHGLAAQRTKQLVVADIPPHATMAPMLGTLVSSLLGTLVRPRARQLSQGIVYLI